MHARSNTPTQQLLHPHISAAEQAVDASESSAGSLASLNAGAGADSESSIASGKAEAPRMAPGAVPYP